MKKIVFVISVVVAAICAAVSAVEAIPITGGISFGGGAIPSCPVPPCTWVNATGVDFAANPAGAVAPGSQTGSYAGVPNFTTVAFTDFTFDPTLAPSPVNPLWTFTVGSTTFSFILDSIAVVSEGTSMGNSFLNLAGSGFLNITGFDSTPADFSFSGQSAGGNRTFSFSASNAAIPEPAVLLMLGSGLVAMAAATRRRVRRP